MFNLYLPLFSFQLFIRFRLILPLQHRLLASLAQYLSYILTSCSLQRFLLPTAGFAEFSMHWKTHLKLIRYVSFLLHFIEKHQTPKSILSQIKNLFLFDTKIAFTTVNAKPENRFCILTQNVSVGCLVCACIKSISFDFPELWPIYCVSNDCRYPFLTLLQCLLYDA